MSLKAGKSFRANQKTLFYIVAGNKISKVNVGNRLFFFLIWSMLFCESNEIKAEQNSNERKTEGITKQLTLQSLGCKQSVTS